MEKVRRQTHPLRRFFLQARIFEEFTEKFVTAAKSVVVGNGLEPGVQMGPLVTERRRAAVDGLVRDAIGKGAVALAGGSGAPEGKGFFYPPTVLKKPGDDARILHEEPFGPVVPMLSFETYDEVIARANATRFALGAFVFTRSLKNARQAARDLQCGNVGINNIVLSTAELPFGGNRDSGYGREGGAEGIQAYLTTKLVSELY